MLCESWTISYPFKPFKDEKLWNSHRYLIRTLFEGFAILFGWSYNRFNADAFILDRKAKSDDV